MPKIMKEGRVINSEALNAEMIINENDRKTSETLRKSQEQSRQTNTATAITNANNAANNANDKANIANTAISNMNTLSQTVASAENTRQGFYNAYKKIENYNNTTSYVVANKVTYQGGTYQNILPCVGTAPTYNTDNANWICIAAKGTDGNGSGDMIKNTYDPTNKAQDIFAYVDNATKSKFDANSQIEFTEATDDVDIESGETAPTLFGKILKRFNIIKANIGTLSSLTTSAKTSLVAAINELVSGKINKTDIINNDTTGGTDKVASAETVKVLGKEVDVINSKFGSATLKQPIGNHISEGVAHRGYSSIAPENTLSAYILAKSKGYKYVECDISWTKDNVPVLIHDDTINRTSNGTGSVNNLTLDQLELYDFGGWKHSDYIGTKIPTFYEFILLCKKLQLHPYIELKGIINQEQAIILRNTVQYLGMIDDVTWISFSGNSLVEILKIIPTARLGYVCNISSSNIAEALTLKTPINEVFIDTSYTTITQQLINESYGYNMPVEVWTINDSLQAYRLAAMGVNGITTDSLIMSTVLGMKETTLAYWKMNETTGTTIADLSGNNKSGTINSGITIDDSIVSDGGKSRTGDGNTGYISTLFNASGLTNFKISFYFRRNIDKVGWQGILNNYRNASSAARGFHISCLTGETSYMSARIITSTSDGVVNGLYPALGVTYKLVCDYDGSRIRLLIYSVNNGVLTKVYDGTSALTGAMNTDLLPMNMLASNNTTPQEYAPFTVDEVKITSIQ